LDLAVWKFATSSFCVFILVLLAMSLSRASWLAVSMAMAHQACGARTRKAKVMSIAGVPVQNYDEKSDGWVMVFKQGTSDKTLHSVCKGRCDLVGHPDAGGAAFAKVRGSWEDMEQLLLESAEGVEVLESDALDFAIPELEAEEIGSSGALSAASLASWGLDAVGVSERPSTGRGVHIYVHDTGVRVSHRDFGGRAIPTLDVTTGTLVECRGDANCAKDSIGHGTHCAATAGGTTYGVSSQSIIHAVKTLADSGSGQRSWNYAAIDWIVANGERPAVSSMSLGGEGQDSGYKNTITAATAAGITIVVAAGNFGADTCGYSPAFVPAAITVGATEDKKRAGYSNWGTCNDIMAPGTAITSASVIADTMSSRLTGTSMACPHVSGAAALLLELHPTWNRDQIMSHLTSYGAQNELTDLKPGDPNLFLWVGRNKAPGPPSCPDTTKSTEPNYWGDCECTSGKYCSRSGGANKDCPSAYGVGAWGGIYFEYTCTDCKCY